MSSDYRRRWRPSVVGLVVAAAVLAALYGSELVPGRRASAAVGDPVFPTTIAPYSWFTGMLSTHRLDAASLLYENGYGVESLDTPQAVLLGTDGSTYRRLGEAEASSVAADQRDPATAVLSPEGTFVVIGSSAPTGTVVVVTLSDGHRREVPTQSGRATVPLAIGADGRSVLLATSGATINRYGSENDLGLARLDLATGAVRGYPTITHVEGAALSPDGSRLAVAGHGVTRVLDTTTGAVRMSFRNPDVVVLDGDAWSPDGRRLALVGQTGAVADGDGESLVVVDVSGAKPVERRHPLGAGAYGAAAIGWRDDATVLVHAQTDGEDNTSAMRWVDAATGAQTSFATYRSDVLTGAAMGGVDAARTLVTTWRVADRPVDRGPWPLPFGIGAAVLAGLMGLALTVLLLPRAAAGSVHRARKHDTPRESDPTSRGPSLGAASPG